MFKFALCDAGSSLPRSEKTLAQSLVMVNMVVSDPGGTHLCLLIDLGVRIMTVRQVKYQECETDLN